MRRARPGSYALAAGSRSRSTRRSSIGYFWPFPHTQLYSEPARLAEAGLLEEERESTGRRRRYYSLTESGRARLREWLGEPVTTPIEYRDLGVLKLFFSELVERPEIVTLARDQAAAQRRQLAEYEALLERYGDRPQYERRILSVCLGIRLARAAAEFWEETAEREAAETAPDDKARPAA